MIEKNLESSEILVTKQLDEIKTAIKAKEGMKCLLRLQENQLLEEKSIRKYQKNLNPSAKEYNAFFVMILTNFNKKIGLFVPKKFETSDGSEDSSKSEDSEKSEPSEDSKVSSDTDKDQKQRLFYWINNEQELVTCTYETEPDFDSNDEFLIWVRGGMWIRNDRNQDDWAWLDGNYWQGIKQGSDGYPDR